MGHCYDFNGGFVEPVDDKVRKPVKWKPACFAFVSRPCAGRFRDTLEGSVKFCYKRFCGQTTSCCVPEPGFNSLIHCRRMESDVQ